MCIFGSGMHFRVKRWHVFSFVIPFDLWPRQRIVPSETSELIERAVSHYLVAKHGNSGVRGVTRQLWQTVVLDVSYFGCPNYPIKQHYSKVGFFSPFIQAFSLLSDCMREEPASTIAVHSGRFLSTLCAS